jgi:hypothetical protein
VASGARVIDRGDRVMDGRIGAGGAELVAEQLAAFAPFGVVQHRPAGAVRAAPT